ncbi:MAG: hypothetical protein ACXAC5_13115 [Promethearchaeota archaeon]|jgi:hypothetical protein
MVNFAGFLDGGTAALIVLSSVIFGIFSLYKSIKLKAKLLSIAGFAMIFVGFLWLGPTVDFIYILLGLGNIDPSVYVILSYLWVAPALLFAIYLGGELLMPKKKWILFVIYVVLGVAFEYYLWFDTTASFRQPVEAIIPGETIMDASFNTGHPTFFLVIAFLISALIFLGIGFAIKAKQSTGLLRRKFIYLSVGFIIFVVSGAADSLIKIVEIIGIIRVVMATFAIWMYLGLKT